jgi:hypothetical protein
MFAGEPGSGKTYLALWHAIQWTTFHNLRGLYFAADVSEVMVAARVAAALTAKTVKECEAEIVAGEGPATESLSQVSGLEFSFMPEITVEGMDLEVQAFGEKWGCWPDFSVVDNLSDVESEGADEWGSLRDTTKWLTHFAKATDTAVLALHHVNEGLFKPPHCPPRSAVAGKVNRKQSLIVTVGEYQEATNILPVAFVKNRSGRQRKDGKTTLSVKADLERAQFSDLGSAA